MEEEKEDGVKLVEEAVIELLIEEKVAEELDSGASLLKEGIEEMASLEEGSKEERLDASSGREEEMVEEVALLLPKKSILLPLILDISQEAREEVSKSVKARRCIFFLCMA